MSQVFCATWPCAPLLLLDLAICIGMAQLVHGWLEEYAGSRYLVSVIGLFDSECFQDLKLETALYMSVQVSALRSIDWSQVLEG